MLPNGFFERELTVSRVKHKATNKNFKGYYSKSTIKMLNKLVKRWKFGWNKYNAQVGLEIK